MCVGALQPGLKITAPKPWGAACYSTKQLVTDLLRSQAVQQLTRLLHREQQRDLAGAQPGHAGGGGGWIEGVLGYARRRRVVGSARGQGLRGGRERWRSRSAESSPLPRRNFPLGIAGRENAVLSRVLRNPDRVGPRTACPPLACPWPGTANPVP